MLKKKLREKYTVLRQNISSETRVTQSITIANTLLDMQVWQYEFYHLFLPITTKNEVDTTILLSVLQGKDKNVVVPKVGNATTLEHYLLTDTTKFITNNWGVPEPTNGIPIPANKLDVVFIPLLAFDNLGHRVGYGKGFYDSFLKDCRKDILKIGLSFFEAETVPITDIRKEDITLDYCVTPKTVYSFSSASGL